VNSKTATRILELLDDRDFQALGSAYFRDSIPWSTFRELKMPEGLTSRQAWDILGAMSRLTGFPTRKFSSAIETWWYTVTPAMHAALYEIEALCRDGSPLSHSVSERARGHFVVQPVVDEMLACVRRDGLALEYEAVREILREDRAPADDAERLVANTRRLLSELGPYLDVPFTRTMIVELQARIAEGVGDLEVVAPPHENPWVDTRYGDPEAVFEMICSMGNASRPETHIVITMIMIAASFWAFRPFPRWNGLTELVIRRLFLHKREYAALSYVPLSATHLAWEQGLLLPPDVFSSYGRESMLQSSAGGDLTPYYATVINLTVKGLHALRDLIHSLELRDQKLRIIIASDPRINYRQREVIERALVTVGAEFDVTSHEHHYSIARSTARADLFELVDLGFLHFERRSTRNVFLASPDLDTLIENHKPPRLFPEGVSPFATSTHTAPPDDRTLARPRVPHATRP
jgi:hypothetical protein